MPYVVDYDTLLHHPPKRRKLSNEHKMARRDGLAQEEVLASSESIEQTYNRNIGVTTAATHSEQTVAQEIRTSSREELIECIKRGEKPTWVPSANLQALYDEEPLSWAQKQAPKKDTSQPAAAETQDFNDPFSTSWTEARGEKLNRRSAFHRGDFSGYLKPSLEPVDTNVNIPSSLSPTSLSASSPPSWLLGSNSTLVGQAISDLRATQRPAMASVSRRRTPSLGSSLSSSFVLRTPTSPLIHAMNTNSENTIRGMSPLSSTSTNNNSRRRTMPPNSFHSLGMLPTDETPPNFSRPFSDSKRDSPTRHFSHQPRRSLSSFTYQPTPSPQTNHARARRSSITTDFSARRRTSMVGSFEESILRGRMSSPASQPFDFVAQIGVMGKGDCPQSLRCPAHVTVPFQAVFYHYPSLPHGRSVSDDAPSPYAGTIDLENNLKHVQISTKRKRVSTKDVIPMALTDDPRAPENTPIGKALARDAAKRRHEQEPSSSKISLGGAYRVPQKGQIQIIIKNQNKTAVKLFLIPYDLDGMEAGTKTFVRQKSYSCGPIIEGIPAGSAATAGLHDPLKDKHILRYLIHLRFCCPAKGKYYLHDHIRVVFANRVPDGKEKLENEVQLPQPRYSPFRPLQQKRTSSMQPNEEYTGIASDLDHLPGVLGAPQSMDWEIAPSLPSQDPSDSSLDMAKSTSRVHKDLHLPSNFALHGSQLVSPADKPHIVQAETAEEAAVSISPTITRALSPVQGFFPSTSTRSSPVPWGSSSTSSTVRSFSPTQVEAGNGLLSQQFRTLYGSSHVSDQKSNQLNGKISNLSLEAAKRD